MNNIKEDILKSSRELFTNYGYKKVSMDEIAKASGVTKKTVYSYFKDKASLLKTLIDEEMAKMKKIIISHSNINDENFFEEVNKTLYDLLKYKREAKLFVTLTKEADEFNTISSKNSIEMIDDAILSFIKERLSWAIEKGYVKKGFEETETLKELKIKYNAKYLEIDTLNNISMDDKNDNKDLIRTFKCENYKDYMIPWYGYINLVYFEKYDEPKSVPIKVKIPEDLNIELLP